MPARGGKGNGGNRVVRGEPKAVKKLIQANSNALTARRLIAAAERGLTAGQKGSAEAKATRNKIRKRLHLPPE